jgi:hypothetical protein
MTNGLEDTPAEDRWRAASAIIAQNESYVGARLKFNGAADVEHGLADAADAATVRQIVRRIRNSGLLLVALLYLHSCAVESQTDPQDSYTRATDSVNSDTFNGDTFPALVCVVVLWLLCVLFLPMRKTLSEWNLVLGGRAELNVSAYAAVAEELKHRQIPVRVTPRRKRVLLPVPDVRNFLVIRLGKYGMFVSVFAFGRDLYLGWSLISRDIPALLLLRYLAEKLSTDREVSRLIDIEPVKALRDVVHNALRTGIEASAVGRQVPLSAVFDQPIPIEDDYASAGGLAQNLPAP